jgi:cell division protein FtsZ
MISYSRDPQETVPTSAVKIIGLGGAGANMLERVALDGVEGAELLALNTDIRTLGGCVAGEKIQLGVNLTKGLGAGGDPALGQQAVLEAEAEIRAALRGRRIVFLCTGLGGGTGSGAAPILTRIAREEGAFVVVFAAMPFAFEGRRRREQADTALNELAVLSNALVTFDNNRMGELVLAKQGIHEAFAAADRMICESIKAVIRLVVRPGLINVGLDDLMSALRTTRSRCLFGSGMANGKDRAARALRNALASPLLDQGALLKEAQTVLVHLSGGEDLTLYEIELLMQRLQKFVPEKAHVLFGAAVDPTMGDSLSVTLISALPEDSLTTSPRESLSRTTPENPLLDPSDGFAASRRAQPEPAARVAEPVAAKPEAAAAPPAEPSATAIPVTAEEPPAAVSDLPFDDEAEAPFGEAVIPDPPAKVESIEKTPAPTKSAEPFSFVSSADDGDWAGESQATAAVKPELNASGGEVSPRRTTLWTVTKPEDDFAGPSPLAEAKPASVEAQPAREPASEAVPNQSKATDPPPEAPKLKLGVKGATPQNELSFETAPRGRFEGESPNVFEGEDLDLPPFLRKKK